MCEPLQLPKLRIIPFNLYSAAFNMAADEFLLSCEDPIIRFYGWKNPTLSFGKSNFNPIGINPEMLEDDSIDKVKRLSGGKTVLHQNELTYSFACDNNLFPSSILETYRQISQPLANAFKKYGLSPMMKKTGKIKSESLICFKEVSSYELTIGPKKIVGSAQYRRRKRFLQHGSILLTIDWEYWKKIWGIPSKSNQLERRITSFNDELGEYPDAEELAQTLQDDFVEYFNTHGESQDFSKNEINVINELQEKYTWKGFN